MEIKKCQATKIISSFRLSASQSHSSPIFFTLQMELSEVDLHHELACHFCVGGFSSVNFPAQHLHVKSISQKLFSNDAEVLRGFFVKVNGGWFFEAGGDMLSPRSTKMLAILQLSHETNRPYFPLCCLFNRGPYNDLL